MNSFSINRFGQTLRWVMATNFRNFLAWTLGAAVSVFLLEMILVAFNVQPDGGNYTHVLLSDISRICMIFLTIFVLVALSTGFADYQKKAKREAFLMLPSSNLEKFLSIVLYVTVVWSLAAFLAFALGDTLRMVVRSLLYHNEWISTVPTVLDGLIPDGFHVGANEPAYFTVARLFSTLFLFVWIHSLYTLCGTLLRKYSFVVASLLFISSVALTAWVGFEKLHLKTFVYTFYNDGSPAYEVGGLGWLLCVALPLLVVFNYWASFHIFKGFQLITNKWTNYDILKR